jgi:hypothetical protein
MSYFEDQYDAWMANDCKGRIEDYDPFDAGNFEDMDETPAVNRNRARNLLALTKVVDFAAWAVCQGYKVEPTKGAYEVLRLRKKGESPVLFFRRDRGEHATSYAEGTTLVQQWINTRKEKKGNYPFNSRSKNSS